MYFFNYEICEYYYPEDVSGWYYLRDKIYECMFLILVVSNWFKNTLVSNSVIVFLSVVVSASIIDKVFFDIFTIMKHDYFIVLPIAISLTYLYYKMRNETIR